VPLISPFSGDTEGGLGSYCGVGPRTSCVVREYVVSWTGGLVRSEFTDREVDVLVNNRLISMLSKFGKVLGDISASSVSVVDLWVISNVQEIGVPTSTVVGVTISPGAVSRGSSACRAC
jgi:hypothetical protein